MARRPLNGNPPITNRHGNPGWGHFNKHIGYDYGVPIGTPLYAPATGRITNVWRNNADAGNAIELQAGSYTHRFLHLHSFNVTPGQPITEGQHIGYTGATGQVTGAHLHHDVRKAGTAWNASYANYVDWEALIKPKPATPTKPSGAIETMRNESEVKLAYSLWRRAAPSAAEIKGWIGKPWRDIANAAQKEVKDKRSAQDKYIDGLVSTIARHKDTTTKLTKTITDLQTALKNEQNKPPEIVKQEVIKIVENCDLPEPPKDSPDYPAWVKVMAWIADKLRLGAQPTSHHEAAQSDTISKS